MQNNLFIDLPMPFLEKSVELHRRGNPSVNCKCMPILLYGLECFSVAKTMSGH